MLSGLKETMIKVAFFPPVDRAWMGGANYYKNLFFAISEYDYRHELFAISFVGKKTPLDLIEDCYSKSLVVKSSLFDRWSLLWFFSKILSRIFNYDPFLHFLLLKHGVKIVSHASPLLPKSFLKVGWVPDFQHVYLPSFFSTGELESRNKEFNRVAVTSNIVLLSSNDALQHYRSFFPSDLHGKVKVLKFVSQVDPRYFDFDEDFLANLLQKYEIKKDFYYIPNQVWIHKNHMVVLKAAKILVENGVECNFIFTGHNFDYRAPGLYKELEDYILSNNLSRNITFLGSVPYIDVMGFIRSSVAVINPSFFEGWSSTVEECKSAGKGMILSDIPVHKEQYPDAIFFDPYSAVELARVIELKKTGRIEPCRDSIILNNKIRTEEYFDTYSSMIKSLVKVSEESLPM